MGSSSSNNAGAAKSAREPAPRACATRRSCPSLRSPSSSGLETEPWSNSAARASNVDGSNSSNRSYMGCRRSSPGPDSASVDRRLEALQALHLRFDVIHHSLKRRAIAGLRLLSQVIHVHMGRHGHLAIRERGEEVTFAASVHAEQTVSATGVELDGAVLDELLAVDLHGELLDAHVECCGREATRR